MGIVQKIKRGKPLLFYKPLEGEDREIHNAYIVRPYGNGMKEVWEGLVYESTHEYIAFENIQDFSFRQERILFLYNQDGIVLGTASALYTPDWNSETGCIRYLAAAKAFEDGEVYEALIHAACKKLYQDGRKKAVIELWDFYTQRICAALEAGFVPYPVSEDQPERFKNAILSCGRNVQMYEKFWEKIYVLREQKKDVDHLERSFPRHLSNPKRENRDVGISIDALADEWLYRSSTLGSTIVSGKEIRAGEKQKFRLEFICGKEGLHPGDSVMFGMRGQTPLGIGFQNNDPDKEGYFTVQTKEAASIKPYSDTANMMVGFYIQSGSLEEGEGVVLETKSPFCWTVLSGEYRIYTVIHQKDAPHEKRLQAPEIIQVLPGKMSKIEVYANASHKKKNVIEIFVRAADEFDNPVPYEGETIIRAGEKSFYAKITGGHAYIECEGSAPYTWVHAQCEDMEGTAVAYLGGEGFRPYFGDLHCHDFNSEAHGTCESVYEWALYEKRMNFLSVSVQNHGYISNEKWVLNKYFAEKFLKEGEFITFLANEWQHSEYGDKIIHYLNGDQPYLPVDQSDYDCAAKLYEAVHATDAFIISHHLAYPNGAWCPATAYEEMDTSVDRLAELWSMHGSSEGYDDMDRPLSEHTHKNTVMEALKKGIRLGFTAGSDTHSGRPGGSHKEPLPYYGGLAGVWAVDLSRKGLFEAIYNRRTYALTDSRIILKMRVNGAPMGSEIEFSKKVHIQVEAAAPTKICNIQLMKNAELYREFREENVFCRISYDEEIESPSFYHVRVVLQDGNLAVCSPVWVG